MPGFGSLTRKGPCTEYPALQKGCLQPCLFYLMWLCPAFLSGLWQILWPITALPPSTLMSKGWGVLSPACLQWFCMDMHWNAAGAARKSLVAFKADGGGSPWAVGVVLMPYCLLLNCDERRKSIRLAPGQQLSCSHCPNSAQQPCICPSYAGAFLTMSPALFSSALVFTQIKPSVKLTFQEKNTFLPFCPLPKDQCRITEQV